MNENPKIFTPEDFSDTFVYRFERGDTLDKIADKFHTTPCNIIALNSLEEPPKEGEYLLIEKIDGREYRVRPTDDLYSLCNRNDEFFSRVKTKNRTDTIYVGMKIII